MPRHRLTTALFALVGTLLATCGMARTPPQAETLQHGPFEIAVHGRRISTGTFPNQGGNPFATREVMGFSVRWRGQAVQVPGRGDRFWNVLRLPDAPQPALLLVQRDFTLVTEQDGQLQVQPLSSASNSLAEAQWLDSEDGQPGEPLIWGMGRVDVATETVLRGGRFLLLGSRLVLDVQKLALHAMQPWAPTPPGQPDVSLARAGDRVRAFSPGRTQYVLAGWQNDYARGHGLVHGLIVVDLQGAPNYELQVDRRRMPFADLETMDGAWISHYFAWQKDAAGRERLVPRAGASPQPWRGILRVANDADGRRIGYSVPRARSGLIPELRRVALQQPGAEPAPDWLDPKGGIDGYTLRVDGCLFGLTKLDQAFPEPGSDEATLDTAGGSVGLYPVTASDREAAACIPVLRRIAQAMDAELASGRHDRHIVLD